jgi:hypothetical protein
MEGFEGRSGTLKPPRGLEGDEGDTSTKSEIVAFAGAKWKGNLHPRVSLSLSPTFCLVNSTNLLLFSLTCSNTAQFDGLA